MPRPLLALVCLLASACGNEAPPPPKIQVVSPSTEAALEGHVKTGEGAYEGFSFPCCGSESATAVVQAYVGLTAALAADDASRAVERAGQLEQAAGAAAQDSALDEASRMQAAKLVDLSGRMKAVGPSLEDLRAELVDMAVPALTFAKTNPGGQLSVVAAYCPMATKPGTWLQVDPVLANPYYGAEMLRCGVFESLDDALKEGT